MYSKMSMRIVIYEFKLTLANVHTALINHIQAKMIANF